MDRESKKNLLVIAVVVLVCAIFTWLWVHSGGYKHSIFWRVNELEQRVGDLEGERSSK